MISQTTKILLEIFNTVERDNTAVLVGGQALLVWAIYYENQGHKHLQVATKDIDILGTPETVTKIEQLLRVQPSIPSWDHATPELGVFRIPLANKQKLTIDILGTVAGLHKQEVEKFVVELEMGETKIKVLNPVGMLKTRIANVVTLRRTGEHSLAQLNATIRITRCFVESLLTGGGYRLAAKSISYILHMAEERDGIQIFTALGIDILDSIPKKHKNYPSSFTNRHLRACLHRIERKRLARKQP